MRTALRTALATALVAGVAITTPAFAAGAAFAADGPAGPAKSAVSAAGATPAPAATTSAPAAAQADPAKGTLVRTETLVTGTVAKIYEVKPQNYRAELFRQGHPVGVLEAITRSAAAQDNGEFFVLNPDGTTHNWIGNTAPNTPGRYRLVDGTVLELGKKDGRFGLQLIENGKGRGYTYVNGVRAVWTFGKAVVVLEQDGQFSAYVPGAARQAAPERVTDAATPAPGTGGVITHGKCTVSKVVGIGAGTEAELFMTRQGPVAEFSDAGDGKVFALVDRAHPSLPASVGFVGRIINPNSATPSLYTKVEGGGAKGATNSFPKLPKGCEPETAPAASATTGTGAVQQGGQTSVVPKGGVAAGAELGTERGSSALMATGAGAASLAAAGLGFVVLRRRAAARF